MEGATDRIRASSWLLLVVPSQFGGFAACLPFLPLHSPGRCDELHLQQSVSTSLIVLQASVFSFQSLRISLNLRRCRAPRVAHPLIEVEAEDHLDGEETPDSAHRAHRAQLAPSRTVSDVLATGKVGCRRDRDHFPKHDHLWHLPLCLIHPRLHLPQLTTRRLPEARSVRSYSTTSS
jgi:hypothetical protein